MLWPEPTPAPRIMIREPTCSIVGVGPTARLTRNGPAAAANVEVMATRREIRLPNDRLLVTYEHRPPTETGDVMFWHHGSPHSGALIRPLTDFADERGLRLVTYA